MRYSGVKDSGARQEFETGSRRDTREGKGRFDLISPIVMQRDAQHLEHGASKYGDRNWEKGQPLSRYFDSAVRHMYRYLEGHRDEDHLAAARWNLGCMMHTEEMIFRGGLPQDLYDLPHYLTSREDEAERAAETVRDQPRIYIAGPMRGIEQFNFPAFDRARDFLLKHDWDVVSPADLDRETGKDFELLGSEGSEQLLESFTQEAMDRDLRALLDCDAIYMLKGWNQSEGARLELQVARAIGLHVYHEGQHDATVDERVRQGDGGESVPGLRTRQLVSDRDAGSSEGDMQESELETEGGSSGVGSQSGEVEPFPLPDLKLVKS